MNVFIKLNQYFGYFFKDLGTPNEKIWKGVSELPGMKKCTFAEYPYNQLRKRFNPLLSDTGFDLMNRSESSFLKTSTYRLWFRFMFI